MNGRLGITKVVIEWKDYQSECFGQLVYYENNETKFEYQNFRIRPLDLSILSIILSYPTYLNIFEFY